MKNIDGVEALKQILIIGKGIYIANNNLNNVGILGNDIELTFDFDIFEIIENLIGCPDNPNFTKEYESWMNNNCKGNPPESNDWVLDTIFEYYYNNLTLEETINQLLEED